MGLLAAGTIVLVRFPFSDLSQSKLRPAVVLADCAKGDWLLCQVTSSAYSDARAVQLNPEDFRTGSLRLISYARPTKLFTAPNTLLSGEIGTLHDYSLERITTVLIQLLRSKA